MKQGIWNHIWMGLLLMGCGMSGAVWAQGVPAAAPESDAPFGAIWVTAVGGFYRDTVPTDQLVEQLRAMPFDEIVVQVRADADAYYQSQLVPKAAVVPERFDPLNRLIEKLHAGPNPKKVIAWFDPWHAGNKNQILPLAANHVQQAHPDWLSLRENRDSVGEQGDLWLEPGLPAVRAHLAQAVTELVTNYAIDGIYFDYIGDPAAEGDWGYHPEIVKAWVARTGIAGAPQPDDPAWQRFRAEIISASLQELIQAAHAARPELVVGVGLDAIDLPPATADTIYTSKTFSKTHQDWAQWLKLDGLNRIYLKNFYDEDLARPVYDNWLQLMIQAVQPTPVKLVVGVSGPHNDALNLLAQLRRASTSGVTGLAIWNSYQLMRDAGASPLFLSALERTVLSHESIVRPASLDKERAEPIRLTVITREGGDVSTPTATRPPDVPAPTESEMLAPPPPPPAGDAGLLPEVPDESADVASLPLGQGRLIDIQGDLQWPVDRPAPGSPDEPAGETPGAPGAATDYDSEMARALKVLSGQSVPPVEGGAPGPQVLSRRELLEELMNDPEFRRSQQFLRLWISDQAAVELKRKYNNIF